MIIFHQMLSSIEGRLPLNVIFQRWSSSIKRHLPSKVVFHWRCPLYPHFFTFAHICSHLLTFVHIGSHLIPFDHTCSQLFTFVYICLQLFTFVHIFSKGTRIMWSVPTLYTNMFIWLITYLRVPFLGFLVTPALTWFFYESAWAFPLLVFIDNILPHNHFHYWYLYYPAILQHLKHNLCYNGECVSACVHLCVHDFSCWLQNRKEAEFW